MDAQRGHRSSGAQFCAPRDELEGLRMIESRNFMLSKSVWKAKDMRILALLPLLTVGLASADTLTLKSGRVMNGTFLGGTAREIRMDLGDHVETIPVERVSTLQFDSSAPVAQSEPPREQRR